MITSATHRPAGITAHHAPEEIAVRRNENSIVVPHVIDVGSASPRNASAVSSKIATAIVSTVFAINSGPIWGKTCRVMIRKSLAPSDRARFT